MAYELQNRESKYQNSESRNGMTTYKLYSELSVSEHYKGNKHRNQIVRQDFPTALSEQIREKEDAERQAALYHQMINEQ